MLKKFFAALFPPPRLKRVKRVENLPNPNTELLFWIGVEIKNYFYGFVQIQKTTLGEQVKASPVDYDTTDPNSTMIAFFVLEPELRFVKYESLAQMKKEFPKLLEIVYTTEQFDAKMAEIGKVLKTQRDLIEMVLEGYKNLSLPL